MDLSSRRLAANTDLVMNYTRVCGVRAQRRGTRRGRSTCAHNRDFFSQLGYIDSIGTSKSCQPLPLRVLAPLSRYRLKVKSWRFPRSGPTDPNSDVWPDQLSQWTLFPAVCEFIWGLGALYLTRRLGGGARGPRRCGFVRAHHQEKNSPPGKKGCMNTSRVSRCREVGASGAAGPLSGP